jgi:hypothetical protein
MLFTPSGDGYSLRSKKTASAAQYRIGILRRNNDRIVVGTKQPLILKMGEGRLNGNVAYSYAGRIIGLRFESYIVQQSLETLR